MSIWIDFKDVVALCVIALSLLVLIVLSGAHRVRRWRGKR